MSQSIPTPAVRAYVFLGPLIDACGTVSAMLRYIKKNPSPDAEILKQNKLDSCKAVTELQRTIKLCTCFGDLKNTSAAATHLIQVIFSAEAKSFLTSLSVICEKACYMIELDLCSYTLSKEGKADYRKAYSAEVAKLDVILGCKDMADLRLMEELAGKLFLNR